jgi:hypothetical protein
LLFVRIMGKVNREYKWEITKIGGMNTSGTKRSEVNTSLPVPRTQLPPSPPTCRVLAMHGSSFCPMEHQEMTTQLPVTFASWSIVTATGDQLTCRRADTRQEQHTDSLNCRHKCPG